MLILIHIPGLYIERNQYLGMFIICYQGAGASADSACEYGGVIDSRPLWLAGSQIPHPLSYIHDRDLTTYQQPPTVVINGRPLRHQKAFNLKFRAKHDYYLSKVFVCVSVIHELVWIISHRSRSAFHFSLLHCLLLLIHGILGDGGLGPWSAWSDCSITCTESGSGAGK